MPACQKFGPRCADLYRLPVCACCWWHACCMLWSVEGTCSAVTIAKGARMLQSHNCKITLSSVPLFKCIKVQALMSTELMAEHTTFYD